MSASVIWSRCVAAPSVIQNCNARNERPSAMPTPSKLAPSCCLDSATLYAGTQVITCALPSPLPPMGEEPACPLEPALVTGPPPVALMPPLELLPATELVEPPDGIADPPLAPALP